MGQTKKDRTWPLNLRQTRHVWIKQEGFKVPPVQGFVLHRRRHSYRWYAYVIWVDAEGRPTQDWVPYDRLSPVRSRDFQVPGNPNYFPGW